jgi:multisubunit Na+/H+ antiporter MnhB subunit
MRGLTGMGFSAVAIIAGAIMYFAVTTRATGFSVSKVGVILMVAGAIGLVISGIIFATTRSPGGRRHQSYDREAVDSEGRSTVVHEEVN